MNKILIPVICTLIYLPLFIASGLAAEVPQRGYTTSTLREPVFELAQVVVEVAAINNWLNSNYENLSYEQMKGPREHLYYLIDSYAKSLYAKDKIILPDKQDLILQTLFSWSERLGVYGGSLVYNAVKSPDSVAMIPVMKLPDQITMSRNNDLLVVSATKEGWSVKVPYYFMIWNVNDFTATNGMRMQLVALSTGASIDKSEAGRSQATIMLMFSPSADFDDFSKYWKKGMGIDDKADKSFLDTDARKSLHYYDAAAKLHKEITIWREPHGLFAVAYLGIDGSYQWNRPHFLDFLRSLETTPISPHNQSLNSTPKSGAN